MNTGGCPRLYITPLRNLLLPVVRSGAESGPNRHWRPCFTHLHNLILLLWPLEGALSLPPPKVQLLKLSPTWQNDKFIIRSAASLCIEYETSAVVVSALPHAICDGVGLAA